MKKLLLFFVPILLLGTGCTQIRSVTDCSKTITSNLIILINKGEVPPQISTGPILLSMDNGRCVASLATRNFQLDAKTALSYEAIFDDDQKAIIHYHITVFGNEELKKQINEGCPKQPACVSDSQFQEYKKTLITNPQGVYWPADVKVTSQK